MGPGDSVNSHIVEAAFLPLEGRFRITHQRCCQKKGGKSAELSRKKKKKNHCKQTRSFIWQQTHIEHYSGVPSLCLTWSRGILSFRSSLPSPLLPSNGLNYSPLAFSCFSVSSSNLWKMSDSLVFWGQLHYRPRAGPIRTRHGAQTTDSGSPKQHGYLQRKGSWAHVKRQSHKQGSWWQVSLIASFTEISAWFLTWTKSCFHGTSQNPVPRLQIQSQGLGKKGYELSQCRQ